MIKTFTFKGDEVIGTYVINALQDHGYLHVSDVKSADIVFVHCLHTGAIEDVFFDEEGLVKETLPETFLVNLSPSTPSLAREISAVSAVNDLRCIEAPFALVDPFAKNGYEDASNLVIYMGGESQDCFAVEECLKTLADKVIMTDDAGSAQLAKVCHTIHQASHIIAAIEELALCHDLHQDTASHQAGEFPLFEMDKSLLKLVRAVDAKDFSSGYTNAYLMSDVAAAMAAADDDDLILPQLEAALHILELFGIIGGADKNIAALALLYRDEEEGKAVGLDWGRAENYYRNLATEAVDTYGYEDDDFDFGDDIDYLSN